MCIGFHPSKERYTGIPNIAVHVRFAMEITNRWVLVDVYRPRWTLCSLCACVTTWVRLWSDTCTGCSSKTCVAFNEFSFESRISRLGRLGMLCTYIVSISVSYSCRLCISTCTGKKERFDGFDAGIKGTLKKTELVFLREGRGKLETVRGYYETFEKLLITIAVSFTFHLISSFISFVNEISNSLFIWISTSR